MGRTDKDGELEAGVTMDRDGSGQLRTRRTRAPGQEMAAPGPAHIGELRPDPRNARKHSPRNVGTIVDALHEVGAARSIVIDEDNIILAGNATVEAAAEAGITKVQVVEADGQTVVAVRRTGLTAAQKARLALFDNRAAELADGWNIDVLKALQGDGVSLDGMWREEELAALFGTEAQGGLTDPDDVPAERATDIVPGDLFALGDHRLLCGDSTKAEDVARVLAGVEINATITDPPYAVNYDRSQRERGGNASVHAPYHEGDKADDVLAFLGHLPSDVLVMTFPVDRHFFALASALLAAGLDVRKECVWVKDSFSFWPGAQYQQQHEPILVCARKGRPVNSAVPANQSTVFQFARPKAHDQHPTAKPAELFCALVKFHAPETVYEPFCGSGTTIIACEQLARRCYALEIEPRYVQVAIDRWEAFTGRKAEKVGEAVRA